MKKNYSPLRYPGGKTCLYEGVSNIIRANKLELGHYVEPYAGGCGLALALLYNGVVSEIHINDIDISIWAFWDSVLNKTDAFIELIRTIPITIDEWQKQRQIHSKQDKRSMLKLGFSTFFLNRTNRSGIIKGAGAIGGLSQKGNYKLDCRFNREALIERIQRISKYKSRIHLTRLDAKIFMDEVQNCVPKNTLFCIDPPYFNKGRSLYTSFYGPDEHKGVSDMVLSLQHPWIVTYDNTPEIRKLYKRRRQFVYNINYSIQTKRIGTELLIASKGLKIPAELGIDKIAIAA
jgi:DNA adenine methylase